MTVATQGSTSKGNGIATPSHLTRLKAVLVSTTPKGGGGKTETADCLEAALSLSGLKVGLVDVDDGNRGLLRRVGKKNVITLDWSASATSAPEWISKRAEDYDVIIFDLGAGIDSSDLPIMSFLGSAWRKLADRGIEIIVCAVVSTNAHTSAFVERLERKYEGLGKVVPVLNNQDGSRNFQEGIRERAGEMMHLPMLPSGFQMVRLARKERLSDVIANPEQEFSKASAFMGHRVAKLAQTSVLSHLIDASKLERFGFMNGIMPQLRYLVRDLKGATDGGIKANARLTESYQRLLDHNITPEDAYEAVIEHQNRNKVYKQILAA